MKSYIYLKAIIIIISNLLNGQINTEEMRFESLNDGIHNSVGMNLGFEQANVQQFDASSNYRMDYIKNNNHFFITSNYSNSYSKKKNESVLRYANKGFIHLRFTKKIIKKLFLENYSQIGFNDFLEMKKRSLFGIGIRRKINFSKNLDFYFGSSLMREIENYNFINENNKELYRSSNYYTFKFKFGNDIIFGNTIYHQIDINKLKDQRILYDGDINININEKFSISIDINYRYDSLPHGDLGRSYLEIKNGLKFKF